MFNGEKKPTTIVRRLCIGTRVNPRMVDRFILFDFSCYANNVCIRHLGILATTPIAQISLLEFVINTNNIRYIHISVQSTNPQQLYDNHAVY